MAVCQQCGKQWPDDHAVCPDDGTRLSVALAANSGYQPAPAIAPNDDLPMGSMAGEYQLEQKLGQGGMGVVYGARHPVIGKRAAIKVIAREMSASQEAVDRFVREAQAVNQIGHPNIVDVFGFGRLPDGRSFFVMEWLQGESLRGRMQRPLPLAEALDVLEQITTAMQAAHEAGVLHRDLKPDNVFLQRQKTGPAKVKVLDFGLAKLSGGDDHRMDHTRTGVVMGTPLYISPEQAKGIKVDFATDVYSLGAIGYEMCAGKVPFNAESAVEVMAKHISERVVPLFEVAPHTPPALDGLVLAMLAKDPRQRPTLVQVHEQLVAIRAQLGSPAVVTAPMAPEAMAAPRKSRNRLVIGVVAAAVVAAGATTLVLISGDHTDRKQQHAAAEPPPAPVRVEPPKHAEPVQPVVQEPPRPVEPPKPAEPKPPDKKQPPAAPTKQVGSVTIQLEGVARGRIWVDGKLVAQGVTEKVVELPPGDHKVHAESPMKLPANEVVHVTAQKNETVKLTFEPRRSSNEVHNPFEGPEGP